MNAVMASADQQRKKIHPYKFTLWVGIGSIIMMFAGFTSAYIVKREQPGWITFSMPVIFWYSTAVMLLSSVLLRACRLRRARRACRRRERARDSHTPQ